MKNSSLAAAVAIVVLANAFTLIHAARNRQGVPDADITLTSKELSYFPLTAPEDDDSGVTLQLRWTDPTVDSITDGVIMPRWLDRQKLQALGFDCSPNASGGNASEFYQRQLPRQAFVALEFDGRAWQAWLDANNRFVEQHPERRYSHPEFESHLVAIDADVDAGTLRARHPDGTRVIIVAAVIAISLDLQTPTQPKGWIRQISSSIHLPRPFSDTIRRRYRRALPNRPELNYTVHLRFGKFLEPWVTSAEFIE